MKAFGDLTKKYFDGRHKRVIDPLDCLFQDSQITLRKISTVETECKIAIENLHKLTTELQTKRLRYNAKSACKYFTL